VAYSVFLSHSGEDLQVAQWLALHSLSIGVGVYLFEHDAQPGAIVSDKIKREIERADALIALLTPHSQISAYVQQEIGYAEALKKLIVPIVFPGYEKSNLAMLDGREYVAFDDQAPQSALQSLLSFLSDRKQAKEEVQAALVAFGGLLLLALLGNQE